VRLAVALLVLLATGGSAAAADRVLVFSRTEGFRHDSIAAGIAMVRAQARKHGMSVVATEETGRFTDRGLRGFDALVFLQSTGDVLEAPQERAVERFIRRGGGWLGIHAAADAETGWDFYQGTLLGDARFAGHPAIQRATLDVVDRTHPATRSLPRRWVRTDEWYAFTRPPRGVHVLIRIDESTYAPGGQAMGRDHAMAWWRTVGRGRAFYTALGHTTGSYAEGRFRRHVGGALAWVVR
jgi:type 1 glutamine amidotransferase